jgi:hypothetical protein
MKEVKNIAEELQNSGKLPLVEVHILRPTGGEMYNRGFNGRHKTLTVGGTVRNRFSSQSDKHAIRYQWEDRLNTRTRLLPEIVRQGVKSQLESATEEDLTFADGLVNELFSKQSKTKKGIGLTTAQVHALSEYDVEAITEAIVGEVNNPNHKKIADSAKELRTGLEKDADSRKLDTVTALFGRMSTESLLSTVYSAVQMNHAYSVNPAAGDYDDFAAVDDYAEKMGIVISEEDEEKSGQKLGAGMIQTTDIASNVYYQYASVCERILFENLCRGRNLDDPAAIESVLKETKEITARFVKDFIFTLPGAKQNSNASYGMPECVYMTVGTKVYPMTMDSAYEKVIIGTEENSVADQAVDRMLTAVERAHDGAFAVNDYAGQYWMSDRDDTIPDYLKKIAVKDLAGVLEV